MACWIRWKRKTRNRGGWFKVTRKIISRLTIYVLAFMVFIYTLFPIYWIVISALRGPQNFFEKSTNLLPTNFSLDFFMNLLEASNFLLYYKNSFVVSGSVTIITVIAATMMAYVITRFRFIGRNLLLNGMLIGYMLPPMLLAIPLLGTFIALGIDDTLFALIISHVALTLPFGVWMLNSFFKTIPYELEESSWIDGATRFQSLVKVIFPLMLPGIISVAIFSFILSFVDYTFSLMIVSSAENKTLTVGLAEMRGSYTLQWGELLAGASLIAAPMIILFSFVTKHFIKGLTSGAVKG